jgi:hypothetical protein
LVVAVIVVDAVSPLNAVDDLAKVKYIKVMSLRLA